MSRMNLQSTGVPQAPPPQQMQPGRGVLGANQFSYRPDNGANEFNYRPDNGANQFSYRPDNGANQYNYRQDNGYNYRQNDMPNQYNDRYNDAANPDSRRYNDRNNYSNRSNVYYNRSYRSNRNERDNYQQQRRVYLDQRRNSVNQPFRQRSVPRQQQRGPRTMRLNDFMPPQLRERERSASLRNLPTDFDLGPITTAASTRPTTPVDALPQRPNFATQTIRTTNDTTQPFAVSEQQDPHVTTSSYRRRQRRVRQQDYRSMTNHAPNRFMPLVNNEATDLESNMGDDDNFVPVEQSNQKQDQKRKTKKQRAYLEPNRILRYLQDNATPVGSSRGNQGFALATTSIYDAWVRDNYDLQVWQAYLKMGSEDKHWAKEVVQRTKRRDDHICTRFVQKKINQLTAKIAQSSASITNLQVPLCTYWTQINPNVVSTATTATVATNAPSAPSATGRTRDPIDRIEKIILKYVQHCTQHVKKLAQNKIRSAKLQMEEFKALQDFEQIATPLQWSAHLSLKPKMKQWSTKNKNCQLAVKRVEYDLPPTFISKTDFSFKIDESIIEQGEAQAMYNQMRQITKEYRTQAMTLYVQSLAREYELLSNEIKRIILGFPKDTWDETDGEPGFAAFSRYNELREKRMNLETEQSIYFLEEQRVEGDPDNHDQPIVVAPTLTRSLGEDFLLQQ
jgi:hypothetical protein